jgi:hypothetical protein
VTVSITAHKNRTEIIRKMTPHLLDLVFDSSDEVAQLRFVHALLVAKQRVTVVGEELGIRFMEIR